MYPLGAFVTERAHLSNERAGTDGRADGPGTDDDNDRTDDGDGGARTTGRTDRHDGTRPSLAVPDPSRWVFMTLFVSRERICLREDRGRIKSKKTMLIFLCRR